MNFCLTFTKQTHQPWTDNPTASQNWCHFQNHSLRQLLWFSLGKTPVSSFPAFPVALKWNSWSCPPRKVLKMIKGSSPGSSNPAVFGFLFQHLHWFWGKLCSLRMPSQTVTDILHLRCHESVLLCPLIRSPLFRNCKLQDSSYLLDEPARSQLWL